MISNWDEYDNLEKRLKELKKAHELLKGVIAEVEGGDLLIKRMPDIEIDNIKIKEKANSILQHTLIKYDSLDWSIVNEINRIEKELHEYLMKILE